VFVLLLALHPHDYYLDSLEETVEDHEPQLYRMYLKHIGSNYFRYAYHVNNEFHGYTAHPVERALDKARLYSQGCNEYEVDMTFQRMHTEFKKQREIILNYLEPQYQRIVEASLQLNQYIKEEKNEGGIFVKDENFGYLTSRGVLARGRRLLKEYAEALGTQDMHPTIKDVVRDKQNGIRKFNSYLEREQLLEDLSTIMSETNFSDKPTQFIMTLQRAIDGMDTQYLRVRAARKSLFKWDALK